MAGVSELETGGVRYGGADGDVIAASEKMIFDWVKAPRLFIHVGYRGRLLVNAGTPRRRNLLRILSVHVQLFG